MWRFLRFCHQALHSNSHTGINHRQYGTTIRGLHPPKMKIAVLGASGNIGQPMSLLLKHSTICTELSLYDITGSYGVAADLGLVETRCKVKGYMGAHQLHDCLEKADIVMITAGVPRRAGMNRDDLFQTNSQIIFELVYACAEVCPQALIAILTNPINSTIPVAAEVLRKLGHFDSKRLFGVTTLDVVAANSFIAERRGIDPACVICPVIGGHSGITIVPVISQCQPKVTFDPKEIGEITERIQEAGTNILKAKDGTSSATLTAAYAGARFAYSLMRAMRGEKGIIECAYVKTDSEELPYFSTQLLLGPYGIEKNFGVGKLSAFEKELLQQAIPVLKESIEKGERYAKEKVVV